MPAAQRLLWGILVTTATVNQLTSRAIAFSTAELTLFEQAAESLKAPAPLDSNKLNLIPELETEPARIATHEPSSQRTEAALEELDLDPQWLEESPVLRRWLEETPDLNTDIRQDPALRTRLRVGYTQIPSGGSSELWLGVEDVILGNSRFTLSGEYRPSLEDASFQTYGGDVRYYLRPLGATVNISPVMGYRRFETEDDNIAGLNLGIRLLFALSRGGGGDIALSQSWVNPGSQEEMGLTTLSTGYALTSNLRLASEFQIQNTPSTTNRRLGVGLEWMF
jgi:hypothetical protein